MAVTGEHARERRADPDGSAGYHRDGLEDRRRHRVLLASGIKFLL
jgi:hypothetical protein